MITWLLLNQYKQYLHYQIGKGWDEMGRKEEGIVMIIQSYAQGSEWRFQGPISHFFVFLPPCQQARVLNFALLMISPLFLGVYANYIFSILSPSASRSSFLGVFLMVYIREGSRSIDFLHLYFKYFFLQQLRSNFDFSYLSNFSLAALPTFYSKLVNLTLSSSSFVIFFYTNPYLCSSFTLSLYIELVISMESQTAKGKAGSVRLEYLLFCLLRMQRMKVTGICLIGL